MQLSDTFKIPCAEKCEMLSHLKTQHTNYISKFSHELRNPLTLISSSLQLLEKECPQVLESPLWPQINQDMKDTLNLLHDMSALNNIDRIDLSQIAVTGFLEELRTAFFSVMQEKQITFTVSGDPSLENVSIHADRRKLRETLTNLLLNATDAVLESSRPEKSIAILAYIEKSKLNICVRDNGPGISKEHLPAIFDPFVTHKSNGTGLGLNIAHSIIVRHNGYLTVDTCTNPNESYTEFRIVLPIMQESDV